MKQGKLINKNYRPRIVDKQLSDMLDVIGAVEVEGVMWCGKTWTAQAFGNSISKLSQSAVRATAEADPSTALIGDMPHVIDEWQDVPAIWDEVRNEVDTSGECGRFILTGSSRPKDENIHHSGAGRIARLKMHTMTMAENGLSSGKVSLKGLFNGNFEPVLVNQKLMPLAEYICAGGWPALLNRPSSSSKILLESYFDAICEVSIPRLKLNGRDARNVMQALARNICSAPTLNTIAKDSGFGEDRSAANMAAQYIRALEDLYVIEALNGWDAPIKSKSRLRTKPKYYFADPSLAASLLGVSADRLLSEGQLFGQLFESLCIHDLLVYASAIPGAGMKPLSYFRDADGLEVDAIIELKDGRWAAFEIKLGENKFEEGAASLNRLKNKISLNPAARNPEPEFMAVIVGAGDLARFDKEKGVYLIPITCLKE